VLQHPGSRQEPGDKYLTDDLFAMYVRSKNGAPCAVPANLHGFPIEGDAQR
jgi:hypothetical protein